MKTLKDWPLNEAFSFVMPPALLQMSAVEIVNNVKKIYREWRQVYSPFLVFPWMNLAFEVKWKWHDDQMKPLPRRLAECLFKNGSYKLSSSFWGDLGNELREKIPLAPRQIMRITNDFTWSAGAFGDHGSCMWESRATTRRAMGQSGQFLALQFFDTDNGNNSRSFSISVDNQTFWSGSRCWAYPTTITINKVEEPVTVIFNSYGSIPLQQMAVLVQGLMEAEATKRIKISNQGSTSGGVYVNSGGGILVGSQAVCDLVNHIDFSFKSNYDYNPFRQDVTAGGPLRTGTGAILNARVFRPMHNTPKKPKKHQGQYFEQKDDRRIKKKELLKHQKKDQLKFRRIYHLRHSGFDIIEKKLEVRAGRFTNLVKEACKSQSNYRGTTKSEVNMYYSNRSRLMNALWYTNALETEFPRQSKHWRSKFNYYMSKHHYDIWSWMSYQFNLLIKEV